MKQDSLEFGHGACSYYSLCVGEWCSAQQEAGVPAGNWEIMQC